MIKFILGLFVGGICGVITTALCVASGRSNEQLERIDFDRETE